MTQLRKSLTMSMIAMIALVLGSCSVPKNVAYFQDLTTDAIIESVKAAPIQVRPGDKLNIIVKTTDPQLSALYNLPVYSSVVGQSGAMNGTGSESRNYSIPQNDGVAGYTVSEDGDIEFPVLGKLHVAGMTRSELSGFIKGELMGREHLKNPTVVVEFLSSGVSVMGEVINPGRYDLNRDKLNVLQALSLAGDLTINGQRENVRVIRENNGKVETYVLNLLDFESMMKSPGYWLQQDDIIYVEPDKIRKRSTTVNGNNGLSLSFWMSVASVLTSVVTTVAVFIVK